MIDVMTRPRDLTTSEWFHIVHKGADGQDIFSAVSHRTMFGEFLADALQVGDVDLHAYAWMTNHTHHLVHAPNGGIPEVMHRLGTRYAAAYNGWTSRSGPLFTARYFSEPITSDEQLIQTARYIHRNPLPIVGSARLIDYRWSSLGAVCGKRPAPDWLASGFVSAGFGPGDYERYVLAPQPSDRVAPGALPPLTPTTCADIERAVSRVVGRAVDELRSGRGRERDDARTLMIALAVEFRSADTATLAERYGLADPRCVRRTARRSRARVTQSTRIQ